MNLRKNVLAAVGVLATMWSVGASASAGQYVYDNITVPAQNLCAESFTRPGPDYGNCVRSLFAQAIVFWYSENLYYLYYWEMDDTEYWTTCYNIDITHVIAEPITSLLVRSSPSSGTN